MKENTPGLCNTCCGPVCREKTLYTESDWAPGTGGTISVSAGGSPEENEISLDGPVDPAAFIDAEAYQVDFALKSGQVTFTVDDITIVADAVNQQITVDGQTIAAGRTAESPLSFPTVHLRVTPDFICLYVVGNYEQSGLFDGFNTTSKSHAILTVDRDGSDPPTTFTCEWDTAVVSGFEISSSQVVYADGDYYGSPTLNCWTVPGRFCPYIALKALSQNHLYRDDVDYGQDLYVPDLTLSGYDHLSSEPPGDLGGTYIQDTENPEPFSLPYEAPYDIARHAPGGCGMLGIYRRTETPPTGYQGMTYELTLDWGTPSFSDPYPKPTYRIVLGANGTNPPSFGCPTQQVNAFDATVSSIAVNDLKDGFTISVSAAFDDLGALWTEFCPALSNMAIEWNLTP